MVVSAKLRFVRISARKARLVIDLIRGKPAAQALSILKNTPKRAAVTIDKLLRSALANARHKGIEENGLMISRITADEGPMMKRFRANAFGRGTRIRKRTCHISVELGPDNLRRERPESAPQKKTAAKRLKERFLRKTKMPKPAEHKKKTKTASK